MIARIMSFKVRVSSFSSELVLQASIVDGEGGVAEEGVSS
jgi:hypothetical protein